MSAHTRPWLGPSLSLLLIFALPTITGAQTPDLAGTWTLNTEKSELPKPPEGARRGGGMMRGDAGVPGRLVITVDGDRITITRPMRTRQGEGEQVWSFAADGKPHAQESRFGSASITASWKEGTLIIVQKTEFERQGRTMSFEMNERYTLSGDGATLTVEGSRSGRMGMGETSWKAVYDRKK